MSHTNTVYLYDVATWRTTRSGIQLNTDSQLRYGCAMAKPSAPINFVFDTSSLSSYFFHDTNKPPLKFLSDPQISFSSKNRDLTTAILHQESVVRADQETVCSPSTAKSITRVFSAIKPPVNHSAAPEHSQNSRTVHICLHNHHGSSTPEPSTVIQTRKYTEDSQAATLSYPSPRNHQVPIEHLSTTLSKAHLSRDELEWVPPKRFTPQVIGHALYGWSSNPDFMSNARYREKHNPFTAINMNRGWNRAKTELLIHFSELPNFCSVLEGGGVELTRIKQSFAGFSLWKQLESVKLDETRLLAMGFDFVFKGEDRTCGKSKKVGSWWGSERKTNGFGIAACCKSACFQECNEKWLEGILDKVDSWKAVRDSQSEDWHKRKRGYYEGWRNCEGLNRGKRIMLRRRRTGRVLSEKWRARRRVQEMKKGRWTDGTLRMDRMWEAFHWVLNRADPLKCTWNRQKVCGRNLWV